MNDKNTVFGKWIPVSERLPKKPMYGEDGYIVQKSNVVEPFSAYWDGVKWTDSDCYILEKIIAWMPLPERYKPPKKQEPQWKTNMMNKFTGVE